MYLQYEFVFLYSWVCIRVYWCSLESVITLIMELWVSQEALKRRSMGIQCGEWPPVHSNKPDCWPAGDKYIQSMQPHSLTPPLAPLTHSIRTRNKLTTLTAWFSHSSENEVTTWFIQVLYCCWIQTLYFALHSLLTCLRNVFFLLRISINILHIYCEGTIVKLAMFQPWCVFFLFFFLVSSGNRPRKGAILRVSTHYWCSVMLALLLFRLIWTSQRYKMRQEMGHRVREGRGRPPRTECNWGTTQRAPVTVFCPTG